LFLSLGLLLFVYAEQHGIILPTRGDEVFPFLAMNYFPAFAGVLFILGITAAAYSSADSTLTALTTSFCYDILNYEHRFSTDNQEKIRKQIHFGFTILMFVLIVLFKWINDQSIIKTVLTVAGYTYGPLLGLFAFGLITKSKVKEKLVPIIAILAPVFSFVLNINSSRWFWGYTFGFEILLVNGLLMMIGLWAIRRNDI
jgi:Na+/proline symporter